MKNALRLSVPVILSILAFGASAPFAFASTNSLGDIQVQIGPNAPLSEEMSPGDTLSFTLVPDNSFTATSVTYQISDDFSGTSIVSADINSNGIFLWTPSTSDIGFHNLMFTVSDGTNISTVPVTVAVDVPPPPACTLSANPTSLAFGGGSSMLSWTTAGAMDATTTIDNGVGVVSPVINSTGDALPIDSGSQTVSLTKTTTYTLTIFSLSGETTCTVGVSVAPPPPPPAPTTPTNKNQCKDGDWQTFTGSHFENQGQCVSYVQSNDKANTSVGNLPPNGSPNAKVKIIEYGNYYDPFSRMFFQQTEQQLRTEYIETGKVVMYWKDFVFPDYPGLLGDSSAANAARCANEQGMFWQYHDLLLAQIDPSGGGPSGPAEQLDFKDFGEQLGLNTIRFDRCLDAKRYLPLIEASSQNAVREGVNAVPTFFINGRPVIGAQPLDEFKRIIEEELAKQPK